MAKFSRFQRKHNIRAPKRTIVIATEGEKTEKIYFSVWKRKVERNLNVRILETKSGGESPRGVLGRLKKFLAKNSNYDTKYGDEFWIVVDRDTWEETELLEVFRQCKSCEYNFAVSNPCFELWLNFHQENPKSPQSCSECEKQLTKLLGNKYDKSDYDAESLVEKVNHAVEKAALLHRDKNESFPKEPGTHVYLLVKKLAGQI